MKKEFFEIAGINIRKSSPIKSNCILWKIQELQNGVDFCDKQNKNVLGVVERNKVNYMMRNETSEYLKNQIRTLQTFLIQ